MNIHGSQRRRYRAIGSPDFKPEAYRGAGTEPVGNKAGAKPYYLRCAGQWRRTGKNGKRSRECAKYEHKNIELNSRAEPDYMYILPETPMDKAKL